MKKVKLQSHSARMHKARAYPTNSYLRSYRGLYASKHSVNKNNLSVNLPKPIIDSSVSSKSLNDIKDADQHNVDTTNKLDDILEEQKPLNFELKTIVLPDPKGEPSFPPFNPGKKRNKPTKRRGK